MDLKYANYFKFIENKTREENKNRKQESRRYD